jgi:uncharacterized Zn finger protein
VAPFAQPRRKRVDLLVRPGAQPDEVVVDAAKRAICTSCGSLDRDTLECSSDTATAIVVRKSSRSVMGNGGMESFMLISFF